VECGKVFAHFSAQPASVLTGVRPSFNGLLLLPGYDAVLHVILLAAGGAATGSHSAPSAATPSGGRGGCAAGHWRAHDRDIIAHLLHRYTLDINERIWNPVAGGTAAGRVLGDGDALHAEDTGHRGQGRATSAPLPGETLLIERPCEQFVCVDLNAVNVFQMHLVVTLV